MAFVTCEKQAVLFSQLAADRLNNIGYRNLCRNIRVVSQTNNRHMVAEGKIADFRQRAALRIRYRNDSALVQAELAGNTQDLFGFTGDG